MNLNKEQKKALKVAVEEVGYGFFQDQEVAKGELDDLAKKINDEYGIKLADFKKMVKCHYKSTMEDEKAKIDELYNLYKEIVG